MVNETWNSESIVLRECKDTAEEVPLIKGCVFTMRIFGLIPFLVLHYPPKDWWLLDTGLLSLYGYFCFSFDYNLLQLTEIVAFCSPYPEDGYEREGSWVRPSTEWSHIHWRGTKQLVGFREASVPSGSATAYITMHQDRRETYFPDAHLKAGRKKLFFPVFLGRFCRVWQSCSCSL